MTFDLNSSIVTIGPAEPAVVLSLVIASLVAWLLGTGVGRLTRWVSDPWRRWVYMTPVWACASVLFFVLPNVVLILAYRALHPEDGKAMVCVAMVWPTFLVPTLVGVWAAVRAVQRRDVAARGAALS